MLIFGGLLALVSYDVVDLITLVVECFPGINLGNYATFLDLRENLYPQNRSCQAIREILSLWNLLKSEAFRMFVNSVKLKADTLGTNIFVGFRQVSVLDRLCLWDFDQ